VAAVQKPETNLMVAKVMEDAQRAVVIV